MAFFALAYLGLSGLGALSMKLLLVTLEMGTAAMVFNKDEGSEVRHERKLTNLCSVALLVHYLYGYLFLSMAFAIATMKVFMLAEFKTLPVPSSFSILGFTKDGLTTSNHPNSSAMNTK